MARHWANSTREESANSLVLRNEEEWPKEIEILGAGVLEVNGIYVKQDNSCCYSKQGMWNGLPIQYRVGGGNNCWIITKLMKLESTSNRSTFTRPTRLKRVMSVCLPLGCARLLELAGKAIMLP
jgi:hypothetical protein